LTIHAANTGIRAPDGIARIARELGELTASLREMERTVFPLLISAGLAQPESPAMAELQQFDLTLQSFDALAELLERTAKALEQDASAEIGALISEIRLSRLTERLLACA
jgi:hypothetical protein